MLAEALGFVFVEAAMTQLELAKKGIVSPQMELVAQHEGVEAEFVRQGVAEGKIVIPANVNHKNLVPCGIGQGLKTKVNANIGTSSDYGDANTELEKLRDIVEPDLGKALDAEPSLEARKCLESLLAKPHLIQSPETLRAIRAVQVLEKVGTDEARSLLVMLSKGVPTAHGTQDAKGALERLAKRNADNR